MAGIFIRDQILLDSTFLQKIQADIAANKLPPGSTITLAARQLTFGPNFTLTLTGYNLFILADSFDSGAGGIDVSGIQGSAGAPGAWGNPRIGGLGENGGQGGDGADGTAGSSATNVILFCKTLLNARILSNGGPGGGGGSGGDGGDAGPGQPYVQPDPQSGYPGQDYIQGGIGGDGGNGGNGGDGGDAGQVTIMFVQDSVPGGFNAKKSIQQNGGPGGGGGYGGRGGLPPGTHDNSGGSDGQDGSAGQGGASANPIIQQVDQTTFFTKIRASFAPLAQSWADYRLKVGEFYFRSFRPGAPDGVQNFNLALGEFQCVVSLNPQDVVAPQLNTWLVNNRNIFGLPRDLDLLPDFPSYESVVTDYGGLVGSLFTSATNMLDVNIQLDQKKQDLKAQIASLQDFLVEVNQEINAANAGVATANAEFSLADLRLNNARNALAAANLNAQMKMVWGDVLTLGIVSTAVVGLVLGGQALLAAIPELIDNGGTVAADPALLAALNEANYDAKATFMAAAGGLQDLVKNVQGPISLVKTWSDLLNAQSDPQILALAKQVAECVAADLAARLHVKQAQFALNAAQAKLQRAENDLQRAQNQLSALTNTISVLKNITYPSDIWDCCVYT